MDIVAEILESASNGAKTTRIMYECFVSYPQYKDYIELLLDQGLLEHNKEEKMYHTTKMGKWFLDVYGEINDMFPLLRAGLPRFTPETCPRSPPAASNR